MSPQQRQEIESLARAGKLIDAIKVYRATTGVGLAEAKAAVEAMIGITDQNRNVPGGNASQDGSMPANMERVRQLISQKKKIDAIRVYREIMGGGLKESKDAVDAMEKEMGPGVEIKPGVKKNGCLGLLLIGGGLIGALALKR